MILVLANGLSSNRMCKLLNSDLTDNANLPAWFLEMKTIDIIHALSAAAGLFGCLQGVYLAYTKTE